MEPQNKERKTTGRSMIEMLGVLATIGVLSIGGLAGYKIAMNYHRANETIHDVMLRATNVPMKWADYASKKEDFEFEFNDMGAYKTNNPVGYPVKVYAEGPNSDSGYAFRVEVSGVPSEVCLRINNMNPTAVDEIEPVATNCDVESGIVDKMIFYFDENFKESSDVDENRTIAPCIGDDCRAEGGCSGQDCCVGSDCGEDGECEGNDCCIGADCNEFGHCEGESCCEGADCTSSGCMGDECCAGSADGAACELPEKPGGKCVPACGECEECVDGVCRSLPIGTACSNGSICNGNGYCCQNIKTEADCKKECKQLTNVNGCDVCMETTTCEENETCSNGSCICANGYKEVEPKQPEDSQEDISLCCSTDEFGKNPKGGYDAESSQYKCCDESDEEYLGKTEDGKLYYGCCPTKADEDGIEYVVATVTNPDIPDLQICCEKKVGCSSYNEDCSCSGCAPDAEEIRALTQNLGPSDRLVFCCSRKECELWGACSPVYRPFDDYIGYCDGCPAKYKVSREDGFGDYICGIECTTNEDCSGNEAGKYMCDTTKGGLCISGCEGIANDKDFETCVYTPGSSENDGLCYDTNCCDGDIISMKDENNKDCWSVSGGKCPTMNADGTLCSGREYNASADFNGQCLSGVCEECSLLIEGEDVASNCATWDDGCSCRTCKVGYDPVNVITGTVTKDKNGNIVEDNTSSKTHCCPAIEGCKRYFDNSCSCAKCDTEQGYQEEPDENGRCVLESACSAPSTCSADADGEACCTEYNGNTVQGVCLNGSCQYKTCSGSEQLYVYYLTWDNYSGTGQLDKEEDYYDDPRIGCCALDPWKTPGGLVDIGMYRMFGGGMLCCPDGETTYAFKSADTCEYSFGHECFAGEPDYVYCSTTEPQSSKNDCLSVAKSIETGVYRDDFVLDTGYECVSFDKDYCPNGYSNWKGYNIDYDTYEYVECKENVCDAWKRECLK